MRLLSIVTGISMALALQGPALAAENADETAPPKVADTPLPADTPSSADTPLPFDIKDFPLETNALRALDRRHLRLARKSGNLCVASTAPNGFRFHTGSVTIPLNACNIFILDNLVAEANDPAMSAYHYAMTPQRRYNQNRPAQYWRIVRKQVESGRPIPGVGKVVGLNPAEATELTDASSE